MYCHLFMVHSVEFLTRRNSVSVGEVLTSKLLESWQISGQTVENGTVYYMQHINDIQAM